MTIDVANPLLDIEAMSVALGPAGRRVTVVDRLSVTIDRGRICCVVGESGSGKSVFAMSLMRLYLRRYLRDLRGSRQIGRGGADGSQ